jgi:site-specific DNA recombinase
MSRSEAVRQHHRDAVRNGIHPGNYPIGYMPAPRSIGPHLPDPRTAPAVAAAFELRARGWTLERICEGLHALGVCSSHGKPLTRQALRAILSNPFYIGQVRLNGKEYPGRHQPLVSPELFRSVSTTLK